MGKTHEGWGTKYQKCGVGLGYWLVLGPFSSWKCPHPSVGFTLTLKEWEVARER
jgi:hypothetical protein